MSSFNADIDRLTGYAPRRARNVFLTIILSVGSIFLAYKDACALTEYEVLTLEPPTEEERIAVYEAIERCSFRTKAKLVDPWQVLALVRLEPALGIPEEGRGILPAAWCIEASMMTATRSGGPILGDYRAGRGYISQGPFQIQVWMRDWCGNTPDAKRGIPDMRHDFLWAARCWTARTHAMYAKAQTRPALKRCPARQWVVAEAMVANPRKYGWECKYASKHYQLLGM